MATVADIEYRVRLEQAISRLMPLSGSGDRARIAVPILYPSGSSASVEILINAGKCFVSDLALGQMEAEMHGADGYYDAAARKAATRYHVGYDGLSVFATWTSLDNVESAILSVSNASVFAATNAIYKAVEDKERKKNDAVYEKVARLFGASHVARHAEITGENAAWEAHNIVTFARGKFGVFEFVSANQNSIASKFMMFSDLSKLEDKYILTSVVSSLSGMGNKAAMLQDVSEVLQLDAEDTYFLRRAA